MINRANARPLPTVVLAPISAGEKGAAINNLAAIISVARSGRNALQSAIKDEYMESGATFLDWHYFRNTNNDVSLAKVKMSSAESFFHGGQTKYISSDGHHEAVYDRQGKLLGGRYRGTYNYYSPIEDPWKHVGRDVVPHIIFGP
ncbi:hypothetical protein EB093_08390 [bacterium]|nr:hypothetical protein [bacterium]